MDNTQRAQVTDRTANRDTQQTGHDAQSVALPLKITANPAGLRPVTIGTFPQEALMQTEDELIVKLRASVTHSTLWILAFQEDRRMQKLVTVLRAEEVTQIWPDSMLEKELNVGVSGDGDKLNRVWHLLRFAGWKLAPTYSRPEGGQPSWYGRFTNPDSAFSIWLNFTSTVCRRVQVGTEMKEVPVYEVRCGESSLEPEAPSAPVAVSASDDEIPF